MHGESAAGEFDVVLGRFEHMGGDPLALAITASDALPMTMPASRIERPEWEPPPTGTTSVSPWIRCTQSSGTPSQSVTSCAKLVWWPCPLDSVPIATSTRPSGATVTLVHSRGAPVVNSM